MNINIAIDLHIHSALSPCADYDMTPNNIVNMALLKGLNAIAITDHNSCDNVEPTIKAASGRLLVVPGMEVQTREEAHLLCYFENLDLLYIFQKIVNDQLQPVKNVPEVFGHQLIFNELDEIVGEREELLISSLNLSIDEVVDKVVSLGGVAVPAHINRPSYSIISQLGFIPDELSFSVIEISQKHPLNVKEYKGLPIIFSSDAHMLCDILEREMTISVEKLSNYAILACFKGIKQ